MAMRNDDVQRPEADFFQKIAVLRARRLWVRDWIFVTVLLSERESIVTIQVYLFCRIPIGRPMVHTTHKFPDSWGETRDRSVGHARCLFKK